MPSNKDGYHWQHYKDCTKCIVYRFFRALRSHSSADWGRNASSEMSGKQYLKYGWSTPYQSCCNTTNSTRLLLAFLVVFFPVNLVFPIFDADFVPLFWDPDWESVACAELIPTTVRIEIMMANFLVFILLIQKVKTNFEVIHQLKSPVIELVASRGKRVQCFLLFWVSNWVFIVLIDALNLRRPFPCYLQFALS